jgi:hypothetical protein
MSIYYEGGASLNGALHRKDRLEAIFDHLEKIFELKTCPAVSPARATPKSLNENSMLQNCQKTLSGSVDESDERGL